MNLGRPEPEFSGICLSGIQCPGKNVPEFRIVVNELQQRFALRPVFADAEQVFGGGIQRRDQQISIEKDDARV